MNGPDLVTPPIQKLQAGGTLQPSHVYIYRPQDDELFNLLRSGEYCNILSSRQVGKSSLMERTARLLVKAGKRVVIIDVAAEVGSERDPEVWYGTLASTLARKLKLSDFAQNWWKSVKDGTPNQKLLLFLEDVVLKQIQDQDIVLFLDEIDSTIKLDFTDDLFTAIRGIYNRREDAQLKRLTFCLVGVATPNELVKDRRTTTYNIGRTLDLSDFSRERDDLTALQHKLSNDDAVGAALLDRILYWTRGHPFLTLEVTVDVVKSKLTTAADVDSRVTQIYPGLAPVKGQVHFAQILNFLDSRLVNARVTRRLYYRVVRGDKVRALSVESHLQLRLTGLVRTTREGFLEVRNPIYERVFDEHWARDAIPANWAAIRIGIAAVVLLALVSGAWAYNSLVLVPREEAAASLESTLTITLNPDEALDAFRQLSGELPLPYGSPLAGSRLRGYEKEAPDLYAKFQKRYKSELRLRAQADADDKLKDALELLNNPETFDLALSAGAVAASIGETPLAEPLQRAFKEHQYQYLRFTLRGHRNAVTATAFADDGHSLVTGSDDGTLNVWNVDSGFIERKINALSGVRSASFCEESAYVVSATRNGRASVWRRSDGTEVHRYDPRWEVWSALALDRHQRLLVVGGAWAISEATTNGEGRAVAEGQRDGGVKYAAAYSARTGHFATGSTSGAVRIWEAKRGRFIGTMPGSETSPVSDLEFNANGDLLVAGRLDGTVSIWDVPSGASLEALSVASLPITAVGVCPAHDDLIVVGVRGDPDARPVTAATLLFFQRGTAQPKARISLPSRRVFSASFSPDCSLVATGLGDNTVRVWSAWSAAGHPAPSNFEHEHIVERFQRILGQ